MLEYEVQPETESYEGCVDGDGIVISLVVN